MQSGLILCKLTSKSKIFHCEMNKWEQQRHKLHLQSGEGLERHLHEFIQTNACDRQVNNQSSASPASFITSYSGTFYGVCITAVCFWS